MNSHGRVFVGKAWFRLDWNTARFVAGTAVSE
jgi:hypothetical protein